MIRLIRRLVCAWTVFSGLLFALLCVGFVWLYTPGGTRWLARQLDGVLAGVLDKGYTADPLTLGLHFPFDLSLINLTLRAPDGHAVVAIEALHTDVRLSEVVHRTLALGPVQLQGVRVDLTQDASGVLDLLEAFGAPWPEDPEAVGWGGLPFRLEIPHVDLRGGWVRLRGTEAPGGHAPIVVASLAGLSGGVTLPSGKPEVWVDDLALDGVLLAPVSLPVSLSGAFAYKGDHLDLRGVHIGVLASALDLHGEVALVSSRAHALQVQLDALDLDGLEPILSLGLAGKPSGSLALTGPLDAMAIEGVIHDVGGGSVVFAPGTRLCVGFDEARGDGCAGADAPVRTQEPQAFRWVLASEFQSVDLAELIPSLGGPLKLEGTLEGVGSGTDWPDGVRIQSARWKGQNLDVYGVPVRAFDVRASLRAGSLQLAPVAIDAVLGRLQGQASYDLVHNVLSGRVRGSLVPAWLADVGLAGISGQGHVDASFQGAFAQTGAPFSLTGVVEMTELGVQDLFTAAQAQASVEVRVREGRVHVEAPSSLLGVQGQGALVTMMTLDPLTVDVEDGVVRVQSQVDLQDLSHEVGIYAQRAQFDLALHTGASSPMQVDLSGELGPFNAWGLEGDGGDLTFQMHDTRLWGGLHLTQQGAPMVDVDELSWDLSQGALGVQALSLALRPSEGAENRAVWTLKADHPIAAVWTGEGVRDLDVSMHGSSLSKLRVTGEASVHGAIDVHAELKDFDAGAFAALFPAVFDHAAGLVNLTLDGTGTGHEPFFVARLDASGLAFAPWVEALNVAGPVGFGAGVVSADLRVDGVSGQKLFDVVGYVPLETDLSRVGFVSDGAMEVALTLAPGGLGRLTDAIPAIGALPSMTLGGVFRVQGQLADPDADVQGIAEVPVTGLNAPIRFEVDLHRNEGQLNGIVDVYEGLKPLARIDTLARTRVDRIIAALLGHAPWPDLSDASLYADKLDIRANLDRVPLATLQTLGGLEGAWEGQIGGLVHVTGDPVRPAIDASLAGEVEGAETPVPIEMCVRQPAAPAPPDRVALLSGNLRKRVKMATASSVLESAGEAVVVACGERLASEGDLDTYGLHFRLGPKGDPWFVAHGRVPVAIDLSTDASQWNTTRFDLDLRGLGVPLTTMGAFWPGLEGISGAVLIKGHVGGTLTDPEPDVQLSLDGGGLRMRNLGLEVVDIMARGDVVPKKSGTFGALDLRLTDLSAKTRPASSSIETIFDAKRESSGITGQATLSLRQWWPKKLEASLSATRAWVIATDRQKLRVSGDVNVAGAWPDLEIRGGVAVDQGRIDVNTSDLLATRALTVDPVLKLCREGDDAPACTAIREGVRATGRVREAVDTPTEADDLLSHLDIALDLDLGRALLAHLTVPVFEDLGRIGANLTRADVDARPVGNLTFLMRKGQPQLIGSIDLLEGRAQLIRARFDLNPDSQITFSGDDIANPHFDIGGQMSVDGGSLKLRVSGTPTQPKLELSSEDFGSDAELFMVLLTGQAPSALSDQQGQAAAQALGGLLVNSVLGDVRLGSVAVEGDGTVRVGFPISRTIYVESMVDPTPQLNVNRVEVSGEWSILPKLILTASYGDRLVTGGLAWELRFDGPGREKARLAREAEEGRKSSRPTELRIIRRLVGPNPAPAPDAPTPSEPEETEPSEP